MYYLQLKEVKNKNRVKALSLQLNTSMKTLKSLQCSKKNLDRKLEALRKEKIHTKWNSAQIEACRLTIFHTSKLKLPSKSLLAASAWKYLVECGFTPWNGSSGGVAVNFLCNSGTPSHA
eukprot:Gb_12111 [translate_table: standard]